LNPRVSTASTLSAAHVRELDADEVERRAREWDACVEAAPRPSPFLLAAYVGPWARVHADGARPRLLVAERERRIVGALPLAVVRRRGLRVLEWVGGYEATPADLALASGEPAQTASSLVRTARALAGFDYAHLSGLSAAPLIARSDALPLVERLPAPVISDLPGWQPSRSGRKAAGRRLRRLGELGRVELDVVAEPERLPAALDEAFAVHAARWAAGGDGSSFGDEAGRAFHRRAAPALAARGSALLALVRLDGRAIAFQYALRAGRSLCLFRVGHDPAFARYSPGALATRTVLEAAQARGVLRVELLGGGEEYKLEIADGLDPMSDGIGWPRTPHGALTAAALRAALRARRVQRRRRGARRAIQ
jgi:CelD/BcsL family acetyltransferase involved in cellulose biosynthesis